MAQTTEHRPYQKTNKRTEELIDALLEKRNIKRIRSMSLEYLRDLLTEFREDIITDVHKNDSLWIEDDFRYKEGFKAGKESIRKVLNNNITNSAEKRISEAKKQVIL